MNLNLKVTNLELTDAIRDYAQKKADMIDKYLGDREPISCDMELELTTKHHQKGDIFRAEISMLLAGHKIWVDETSDDLYKAIDLVKDQAIELIKKQKEKRLDARREGQQDD